MPEESQSSREWARQVLKDYVGYGNPQVSPDIDVVWSISGRGLYDESGVPYASEYERNELYRVDDREGTDAAILLVRKITALRVGKDVNDVTKEDIEKNGPLLFYNGLDKQNKVFREAVESPNFPLPKSRVRIDRLSETDDPRDGNTRTQFERFPQELLQEVIRNNHKIALVESRWHLPRIARTIDSDKVYKMQPLWKDAQILYFVPEKDSTNLPKDSKSVTKRAADLLGAVRAEGKKIREYSQKGDVNEKPRYS